jgi:hypothetical protein
VRVVTLGSTPCFAIQENNSNVKYMHWIGQGWQTPATGQVYTGADRLVRSTVW